MTRRVLVYSVELVCMMCGRHMADVSVLDPTQPIIAPSVHCGACGGAPIRSGEVQARPIERESPFNRTDLPRRGRPPSWLVAERARTV